MGKPIFISILLLLVVAAVKAQFTYSIDQSIPVEVNGKSLLMPWAGGVNSAQINTMDLNGDGKQDLVVFDRTANKLNTYLNKNNQYQYAPDYESLFPKEVSVSSTFLMTESRDQTTNFMFDRLRPCSGTGEPRQLRERYLV